MNARKKIELLAAHLDGAGKPSAAIQVRYSRKYLRRFFRAQYRGGPLMANGHPLIIQTRI